MGKKGICRIWQVVRGAGFWALVFPVIFSVSLSQAGSLVFSKPQRVATIPWSNGSNHGISNKGPEWMMVDAQGHLVFVSGNNLNLYSPHGQYLQTLKPVGEVGNFYGFTSMEISKTGELLLLVQLESPLEQWSKDNFEERTKPGARLVVLAPDGKVKLDKEEVDPKQPHSRYYLQDGAVYSIHDDGSYELLDSLDSKSQAASSFEDFAKLAYSAERWQEHLKKIPVFRSENKTYHDINGGLHEDKGALSYLLGHLYVEGTGAVAERNGKIYYQVVCDQGRNFVNAIFVEEVKGKNYGLVELFRSDPDLDIVNRHTVFVDKAGNIFEGVAAKDGYRIYEWKFTH